MKVYQWQQLSQGYQGGFYSRMITFVSALKDIDIQEVEGMSRVQLIEHYKQVEHLARVSEQNKTQINIGIDLNFVDFSQLTLGQFIDLENDVSNDFHGNFCKIIARLYLACVGGELYELKPEPYENINVEYRAQLIEELHISDVYGAAVKYMNWRQKFFDSYSVFKDPFEGVDLNDPENQAIIHEEKQRIQSGGDMWMNLLNRLSDNDVTKFESILRMNLFLVFNQLEHLNAETKKQ